MTVIVAVASLSSSVAWYVPGASMVKVSVNPPEMVAASAPLIDTAWVPASGAAGGANLLGSPAPEQGACAGKAAGEHACDGANLVVCEAGGELLAGGGHGFTEAKTSG